MEAEELDQIFRAKISELDQVPNLPWHEESVWAKVRSKLSPGWGMGSSVVLTALVTVIGFIVYWQLSTSKLHLAAPVRSRSLPPPLRKDSILPAANLMHPKVKLGEKQMRDIVPLQKQKHKDSTVGLVPKERAFCVPTKTNGYRLIDTKLNIDRIKGSWPPKLVYPLAHERKLGFQMPDQKVLSLQVNNTLNLYNAMKVYETLKAYGPNFRYSYRYKPYHYEDFRPFRRQDPTEIYINDYNDK